MRKLISRLERRCSANSPRLACRSTRKSASGSARLGRCSAGATSVGGEELGQPTVGDAQLGRQALPQRPEQAELKPRRGLGEGRQRLAVERQQLQLGLGHRLAGGGWMQQQVAFAQHLAGGHPAQQVGTVGCVAAQPELTLLEEAGAQVSVQRPCLATVWRLVAASRVSRSSASKCAKRSLSRSLVVMLTLSYCSGFRASICETGH